MLLHVSSSFRFEINSPTPLLLMLHPRSGANQWISSQKYEVEPSVPIYEFTDIYGNLCQRLIAPVGEFAITTAAKVTIPDYVDTFLGAEFIEIQNLPEDVLIYLLPSRYCEADRFHEMAKEITSGELLGYNQVLSIVNWIRNTISFEPLSSQTLVSAIEVHNRGYGVCRDLSHLAIAMCRSLSMPARMVVGYLHGLEPMDLHAWFEVYVGNRWYTFDPTQAEMRGGYVVIGYGRDAGDVAIYNQFGPSLFPAMQYVSVDKI